MPAPRRRAVYDRVEFVVVEREAVPDEDQLESTELEEPTPTVARLLRRLALRRRDPAITDVDDEDTDDDSDIFTTGTTPTAETSPTLTIPSGPPAVSRAWHWADRG